MWIVAACSLVPGCGEQRPATEKRVVVEVTSGEDGSVSHVYVSPGEKHGARVFSTESDAGESTQVMVEFGFPDTRGAGGVFAVYEASVPLRVSWRDDNHLVIAYPDDVTPVARQTRTQRLSEVIEVEYQTFTPSAAEREKAASATPMRGPKSRAVPAASGRGTLVELAQGKFRYDYYDVHQPDSSYAALEAKGYQGGGYSWAGIIHGLVVLRRPELMPALRFDPEGEGVVIWSANRSALESVAELVAAAKRDPALLQRAIDEAVRAGEME